MPSRFSYSGTSPLEPDDKLPPSVRLQRTTEEAIYRAFHPDPELQRRMDELPGEADSRTDAVAAVEERTPDGWVARWVVAEQDGAFVVRGLHVEPTGSMTPEGGLTSRMLRELSPTQALARLALGPERNVDLKDVGGGVVVDDMTPLWIKWARQDVNERQWPTVEKQPRGRPRLSDAQLAAVAIAYLEELPKGPGLLARVGARPEIDRPADTVRDWVRKARREGFLTGTKSGRKGGLPGPRLNGGTEGES